MTGRARRQQRKRARRRARIDALLEEFAAEFRDALLLDRAPFASVFSWQADFGRNFATPIAGWLIRDAAV